MRREFIDDYEHAEENIEYILENILQPTPICDNDEYKKIQNDFYSILTNGCECLNGDCVGCSHGGNYNISKNKLLLKEDMKCNDLIYECNENCKCSAEKENCINRLVQYGPCDHLEIRKFDGKGFGLVTLQFLLKGTFICEYAGEVLTKFEAKRRDTENQELHKMNYIFCLNEIKLGNENEGETIQTFIDPSMKGNIGRYLNHSCEPNCQIISVRFNSLIPKLAIFSNRNIDALEELTFSYGNVDETEKQKSCYCRAKNCKNFLPNLGF